MYRRFNQWHNKGIWVKILETLVADTNFEVVMIDANHIKVHPVAADVRGRNQEMGLTIVLSNK